jgi:hypothetical protein
MEVSFLRRQQYGLLPRLSTPTIGHAPLTIGNS